MGQPKQNKRENEWISRGSKQGASRANLRKREKINGLVGLKTGSGVGQPKENKKMNGLVGTKNRGRGAPTYGKERNLMISSGLKQEAGRVNLRKKEKTN